MTAAMNDMERAAIEHAQMQFRDWIRPRSEFSEMRRGVRALLAALPPALEWDKQLLALVQAQPPHMTQQAVVDELERMRVTLQRIDAATTPTKGIRDLDAEMWICFAADAWVEFTGKLPSSGDRSRFLTALAAYGNDVPKVNRDQLRDVLPRWRAFRG